MMLFAQATFPGEFSRRALAGVLAYWGLLSLLALGAPVPVYTASWWAFFVSVPLITLYTTGVIAKAIRRRREGAFLFLVGALICAVCGLHDVLLYSTGAEIQIEWMPLGFLSLSFCQALLLARRFSSAFDTTERLSQELERKNQVLTQLNEATSRFVPFQFLALLGKRDLTEIALGDQVQRDMTILFSDIRSFTSLSESMTPQQNFEFINEYLKHMEPVVRKNQGFIDKYIGDAVMALFEQSADDSVRAAIDMVRALESFNAEQLERGRSPIRIGIGLNTGSIMLGTIGGSERMDGTVISDAVNLAARIEGMTKLYGASILISESTYAALEDPSRYDLRIIDRVQVKGKREHVVVYEIFSGEPEDLRRSKLQTFAEFSEAFDRYSEGRFEEALALFEQLAARAPEDPAFALYAQRCRELRKAPPPDWKGVMQLRAK